MKVIADFLHVSGSSHFVFLPNYCRILLTRWTVSGLALLPHHCLCFCQNQPYKSKLDNVSVLFKTLEWLINGLWIKSLPCYNLRSHLYLMPMHTTSDLFSLAAYSPTTHNVVCHREQIVPSHQCICPIFGLEYWFFIWAFLLDKALLLPGSHACISQVRIMYMGCSFPLQEIITTWSINCQFPLFYSILDFKIYASMNTSTKPNT